MSEHELQTAKTSEVMYIPDVKNFQKKKIRSETLQFPNRIVVFICDVYIDYCHFKILFPSSS